MKQRHEPRYCAKGFDDMWAKDTPCTITPHGCSPCINIEGMASCSPHNSSPTSLSPLAPYTCQDTHHNIPPTFVRVHPDEIYFSFPAFREISTTYWVGVPFGFGWFDFDTTYPWLLWQTILVVINITRIEYRWLLWFTFKASTIYVIEVHGVVLHQRGSHMGLGNHQGTGVWAHIPMSRWCCCNKKDVGSRKSFGVVVEGRDSFGHLQQRKSHDHTFSDRLKEP